MVDIAPSVALRKRMDAALAELDPPVEWTEHEEEWLSIAGRAADRAMQLQGEFDKELCRGEELRPLILVRLSAELRALEKTQADLVARLNPTLGPAKSEQHQRAARSRWAKVTSLHGQA